MTLRHPLATTILLATTVAGLLASESAPSRAPSPTPAGFTSSGRTCSGSPLRRRRASTAPGCTSNSPTRRSSFTSLRQMLAQACRGRELSLRRRLEGRRLHGAAHVPRSSVRRDGRRPHDRTRRSAHVRAALRPARLDLPREPNRVFAPFNPAVSCAGHSRYRHADFGTRLSLGLVSRRNQLLSLECRAATMPCLAGCGEGVDGTHAACG